MINDFGLKIYDIKEVLKDKKVKETIISTLLSVFNYLEIPKENGEDLIKNCLSLAENYSKIEEYEKETHSLLNKEGIVKKIPEKLSKRAEIILSQIKPFIVGNKILDYGCGDGKVGELINKKLGKEVFLTDIYKNVHIKDTGLNFKLFESEKNCSFKDNEFDTTLVLTVYHHSSCPINSIKDCYRITKNNGRILVIESVYGVKGKELPDSMKEKIKGYLSLNEEQQRKVNIFFDHFYNRVIHYSKNTKNKVNVPFNFNTPYNWKKIFAKYNLIQEKVIHLGIDQPTVPEYHTLHILKVKK